MKLSHVTRKGKQPIFFLHVDQQEAIDMIRSLSEQISTFDSNNNRKEWGSLAYSHNDQKEVRGCYFSVAVSSTPARLPPVFKDAVDITLRKLMAITLRTNSSRAKKEVRSVLDQFYNYTRTILSGEVEERS